MRASFNGRLNKAVVARLDRAVVASSRRVGPQADAELAIAAGTRSQNPMVNRVLTSPYLWWFDPFPVDP
jgi:hypothetical protein